MSLIFDALQRLESERSGVDISELAAATRVLELAELRAASELEATVRFRLPEDAECARRNTTFQLESSQGDAKKVQSNLASEDLQINTHSTVFDQFQSMQVEISPDKHLVCLTDTENLAAENFRFLAVRLQQFRRDQPLKKVLITSTIPQEGKSMVAGNLACTLARKTQQKVLLVDGDVRRPSLSQMFGVESVPGLCECLQGARSLVASIYHLEGPNLWILPSGSTTEHSLEVLQSGKLPKLMDQIGSWFDWIVVDSPPVLPFADVSLWTRLTDGILLVARQGKTEKRQLLRGIEAIDRKKLIGAVLNCSKNSANSDYYYNSRAPIALHLNEQRQDN